MGTRPGHEQAASPPARLVGRKRNFPLKVTPRQVGSGPGPEAGEGDGKCGPDSGAGGSGRTGEPGRRMSGQRRPRPGRAGAGRCPERLASGSSPLVCPQPPEKGGGEALCPARRPGKALPRLHTGWPGAWLRPGQDEVSPGNSLKLGAFWCRSSCHITREVRVLASPGPSCCGSTPGPPRGLGGNPGL